VVFCQAILVIFSVDMPVFWAKIAQNAAGVPLPGTFFGIFFTD
jgi:hypothetical protein